MRGIKYYQNLFAVSGLLAVTAIVFGPTLFPPHGKMIFGDDIFHTYYFYREFFNQWLARGIVPWWNPYSFGGAPFIANPIVNVWYPPNWLYIVLPLPIAYAWHLFLHVVWASTGMYILLRKHNRVTALGAWVGGLVFGLSGFFMARTWAGHVDVIAAASWMPWVVGAFYGLIHAPATVTRRIFSPSKAYIFAATAFALQLLSGYQTMAFFTVIAVGFFTVIYSIVHKTVIPFLRAGLAGAMGVALAAVQILPEQQLFRSSIRTYPLPYAWVSYGSWTWKSLLQLINPFYFGTQTSYTGPPPNFIEHSAFVGVGGLLLAVVGIVYMFSAIRVLLQKHGDTERPAIALAIGFFLITVFGIWISLGPNAPVDLQYFFWKIIPMYHYLRIPPRHLILVAFGLAGLSGIGFGFIARALKLSVLVRFVIAGAIVVEMVLFSRNFITLTTVPQDAPDTALVTLLKRDPQPYRVLQNYGVWLPQRDALDFDATMPMGIYSATGYDPSIYRPYFEYIASASGQTGQQAVLATDVQVPYLSPQGAEALDTLNIKYIIVSPDADFFSGNARYTLLRSDATYHYNLYENTTVLPRFYFANSPKSAVTVDRYTPNAVTLTATSVTGQTLYSSEVYYPGWVAYIDGKKTDISVSNGVFRTLFVPAGKHTITYRFSPYIFIIGGVVSVLSLLGCGIWLYKIHHGRISS